MKELFAEIVKSLKELVLITIKEFIIFVRSSK